MSNRLFFGLLYRKPSQNESWQGSWGLVGERSTKQCVSSASKTGFRDKMGGEAKLRLGHPKFWVFFAPQKHSKGFKHAHTAFKHDSKQTKIDRIFSAIFWKKLRGHFRTLKSQNVSHAGTLSVCSLAGSEQVAGMKEVADWRCLKLDAKTLPNSQQQKRTKTQMFKTNCLNCKFLLWIDQSLKRRQFQPNGTKMVQLFLKPPQFFQIVFSLLFFGQHKLSQNLSKSVGFPHLPF